jgi:uncharacterized protein (DUF2147 family)
VKADKFSELMRSKWFPIFIGFLLFATAVGAQGFRPDDIIGTWLTADKTGQIAVYKNSNLYYGKIKAGTSKEKFDVKNPYKERRNDPLIGLIILKDVKFENNSWKNGKVYDPHNGRTYSCILTLINTNQLKITGFIGFSWIGRSEVWTRLE